ncbi:diguanylate cyclase [Spirochaetia bacterium]|nr:diguanylate cyclase [Spirochaetia bacterium]GHV88297.1 diguanylate cyclase [Spirochaetia bacterium]
MEESLPRHDFHLTPIEKATLFSSLLDGERQFVLAHSSILQLRHGGRLFSSGEKADHFYMLLEGSIRVFQSRENTRDDELARFAPGDIIGDFDFARQAVYDAQAEAEEDSVLIMFPGFGLTIDAISPEGPHAIAQILLGSIVMMSGRLRETNKITVENRTWVDELRRRAYEEPGTGLWKQSFLTDEGSSIRSAPTALIMLKPDRFKTLVDTRGHVVGDEAMVRLARVLKDTLRHTGHHGWPMRFKSNETGLLINKCDAAQAEKIAEILLAGVASLEPIPPEGDEPVFNFTATIAWGVWPDDDEKWDSLFQRSYTLLLDTWRSGGNRITRCPKPEYP